MLVSRDTDEATVPATVTIAAGQTTSPEFTISGVNEAIVDGTQTVTVTGSAAAHADGTDNVGVTDDEVATLTVVISAADFSENGGGTTATVSRNTDPTDALTIMLASSDTDEATVPATVTIAAGQTSSPEFTVSGVDDAIVDGTQTVTVTGSAAAHADGTGTVDVTDDEVAPQDHGNVDGDDNFDASDSFLIHLVKLSGTDTQIAQSKGSSPRGAAEIRAAITQLDMVGDVDGDHDFDANDSFLIHVVKLSGTDTQIDQSKGVSSLTAEQIRNNISDLGGGAGEAQSVADGSQVLASVPANPVNADLFVAVKEEPVRPQVSTTVSAHVDDVFRNEFREWIDAI
jgi:hypothetical protein